MLRQLFTPNLAELRWARQKANAPLPCLALLCWLQTFPALGRFLPLREIPATIVSHIAERAALPEATLERVPARTQVRHREEVRAYLGVSPWGPSAEQLASCTMQRIASGRAHLSDLINAAVEALVAGSFELPALSLLRRPAGHVNAQTTQSCSITGVFA